MARRLRPEEIVTIQVLAQQGMAKRAIARQLGLDESSVRYQLEKVAKGRTDGSSPLMVMRMVRSPVTWETCGDGDGSETQQSMKRSG